MLKNLQNNNQGVVFVTVLIIVIVAMILAISALSLNVSQVKSTENELKYLQAEVLADGGLFQMLTNQFSPSAGSSTTYSETVGYTTFNITVDIDGSGSGPAGSESVPLDVNVDF